MTLRTRLLPVLALLLAAFNATSGNLTSLKPRISNGTGNFATVLAMDVSADGTTLYFARDLTLSSSGRTVFVGGRSTGGYVQACGPPAGGSPAKPPGHRPVLRGRLARFL
jgi:hypothetical protein